MTSPGLEKALPRTGDRPLLPSGMWHPRSGVSGHVIVSPGHFGQVAFCFFPLGGGQMILGQGGYCGVNQL